MLQKIIGTGLVLYNMIHISRPTLQSRNKTNENPKLHLTAKDGIQLVTQINIKINIHGLII